MPQQELMKINQINQLMKINQINQLIKINQNRKNPVTQNALNGFK